MLSQRIIATLEFFDLMDVPLTAWEIGKFLVSDKQYMLAHQNSDFDLVSVAAGPGVVGLDTIIKQLDTMKQAGEIEELKGFYALPGRINLVNRRLSSYKAGLVREKIIQSFIKWAGHLPFVRGIGLTGSQALGLHKPHSDIDLFIITETGRMWFARLCITLFFHLLGVRRYKKKIANRFCLNHYLSGSRKLDTDRNLYTALEYAKMRPLVAHQGIRDFQVANIDWMQRYLPQMKFRLVPQTSPGKIQQLVERLLSNSTGHLLDRWSRGLQKPRISVDEFIIAEDYELSFHPENRKRQLFEKFFGTADPF